MSERPSTPGCVPGYGPGSGYGPRWGIPVTSIPWVRWETLPPAPQAISLTPRYLQAGREQRAEIASLQASRCRLLSQGKAVAREVGRERAAAGEARMWVVEKPDLNAWRRASFDAVSIYNLREDTLITKVAQKTPWVTKAHKSAGMVRDAQLMAEKRCILETPIKNPTKVERKRFSKAILQKYHTPSKHSPQPYCTPRDALAASKAKEATLTEMIQKSNGPPEIPVHPKKQSPIPSTHSSVMQHQFCETLGASCCRNCIEETNRKIAKDIEQSSFPALECSASTLVAPTLARMMTQSTLTSSPTKGNSRRRQTGNDVIRKGSIASQASRGSAISRASKKISVILERPGSDVISRPGSDVISRPGSDVISRPGSDVMERPGSRESDVILPPVSGNQGRKSALSVHEHAAEVRRDKLREASKSPGSFKS